jgi:GNAT superfamily N-acetyltransferase
MCIREFSMQKDAELFMRTYNKYAKFAPYSVPMDEAKMQKYVLKNVDNVNEFIYINDCPDAYGIVHFGLNPGNKKEGYIYLLVAEKNNPAKNLLKKAEDMLIQMGVSRTRFFSWPPSPYMYILHGAEVFVWGGNYPAVNAFNHLFYNIDLDIVVMNLHMDERPADTGYNNENITIVEKMTDDDDLVVTGEYLAYNNGKQVGRSSYYYLKAISDHLGRKYGQVDIWINDDGYYGTGLGRHLMALVHQKLFDMGIRNVFLVTNQNFYRAIKFYSKLGYKPQPIKAYGYSKDFD